MNWPKTYEHIDGLNFMYGVKDIEISDTPVIVISITFDYHDEERICFLFNDNILYSPSIA